MKARDVPPDEPIVPLGVLKAALTDASEDIQAIVDSERSSDEAILALLERFDELRSLLTTEECE